MYLTKNLDLVPMEHPSTPHQHIYNAEKHRIVLFRSLHCNLFWSSWCVTIRSNINSNIYGSTNCMRYKHLNLLAAFHMIIHWWKMSYTPKQYIRIRLGAKDSTTTPWYTMWWKHKRLWKLTFNGDSGGAWVARSERRIILTGTCILGKCDNHSVSHTAVKLSKPKIFLWIKETVGRKNISPCDVSKLKMKTNNKGKEKIGLDYWSYPAALQTFMKIVSKLI